MRVKWPSFFVTTDFIEIFDDVLSHEMCKSFLDYIENSHKVRRTQKNLKDIWYVTDCYLNDPNPLISSLFEILVNTTNKYVKKHPQLARTDAMWNLDNNFCLQKYDPDMGYYYSHAENMGLGQRQLRRNLVWMIYLNDVTDGGGTYFENYDKTIDAVEGRCVIWPPSWTHFHNGIVSKTQTKYIATGWYMFNEYKLSN